MKTNYYLMILSCLLLASCAEQEPLADPASLPQPLAVEVGATDEVTTGDIARVAESFFGDGKAKTRSGGYSISTIYGEDGMPAIYAVNFAGNNGFILVSATKRMLPVLAYSETGHYDVAGQKPGGLDLWQASAVEAVAAAGTLPADSTEAYRFMWRKYEEPAMPAMPSASGMDEYVQAAQAIMWDSVNSWQSKGYEVRNILDEITGDPQKDEEIREMVRTGIHPYYMDYWDALSMVVVRDASEYDSVPNFVMSTWHQLANYNRSFPPVGDMEHAYVGCGPVAIGQLMRYYEFPASFEWDDMLLTYPTETTSQFLYDVAEKANAKFEEDKTTTSIGDMISALRQYGYSTTEYAHSPGLVLTNMKQRKPVIMTARYKSAADGEKVGHAWLATGAKHTHLKTVLEVYSFYERGMYLPVYRDDLVFYAPVYKFYMNWGASRNVNGWFADSPLNVPGSSSSAYDRTDICNIAPLQ